MGYTKKLMMVKEGLQSFDYEIDKRLNNKTFGTSEEGFIKSMGKIRDLIELETNLAVVNELDNCLNNLLIIAKKTWKENWEIKDEMENQSLSQKEFYEELDKLIEMFENVNEYSDAQYWVMELKKKLGGKLK